MRAHLSLLHHWITIIDDNVKLRITVDENVTGPLVKGSAFQPGLAYDAGLFEYAAYTCGEDFGIFTTGSCDFLDSIGVPSDPSDLNLPSIAISGLAGSQTVQRRMKLAVGLVG